MIYVDIPTPPEHNHRKEYACVYGCPRFLHYRMQSETCTFNLKFTSTTIGWNPESEPIYLCNKPMPCSEHNDLDGFHGKKVSE